MKSKTKKTKNLLGPSVEERMDEGKKLRERVPRNAHAHWKPPAHRLDPVALQMCIRDSIRAIRFEQRQNWRD